MSLTRKMLKAMELDEEKISQIIEAHQSTVDEVASERDKLKADLNEAKAEVTRLSAVEKDLVKANAKLEEAEDVANQLKDLKKEFADYKTGVEAKEIEGNKMKRYKELLTKAGIPEKRHEAILRVTDLSAVELDADGNVTNAKELSESIDSEWAEFKVTETKRGADVPTPPGSDGGSTFEQMSLADKMAYANDNPNSPEVKAWLEK